MAEAMLLSFSLSASLCVGLPTVTWAFYSLRQVKDAASAFTIALLFSNIVELLISPFVSITLLEGIHCNHLPCWLVHGALSVARLCGLQFHQLVALEGILSLVYPTYSISFLWSSVLSVIVFIFVINTVICHFVTCHFFSIGYTINLIFCGMPVVLAILTNWFIIRLSIPCNSPIRQQHPGLPVCAVSLLILAVLYMPCLVLICVAYPDPFHDLPWSSIPLSIMSLRVVIEPMWCVLLCREIQKSRASLHLEETRV